ncbi:hypothetical protein ABWK22_01680 [Gottfriedia acidiceleris]|uniref:hypothetical protein n=1 Tax=Gottfriedia acidiceleris TaxID=371036 RepID=UPI003394AB26
MTEQKIGIKRLFLNKEQKFLLDIQTLGQEKDPIEKAIIAIENVINPRYLIRLISRKTRPYIFKAYWAIAPKRLRVNHWGDSIYEYLPWFGKDHLYRAKDGYIGKAYGGDQEYFYSWKKAYHRMKEIKREIRNKEVQNSIHKTLLRMGENQE